MFLRVEHNSNLKINNSKLKDVYALNLRMVFFENIKAFPFDNSAYNNSKRTYPTGRKQQTSATKNSLRQQEFFQLECKLVSSCMPHTQIFHGEKSERAIKELK